MANHKWENDCCVLCGVKRRESTNEKYPDSIFFEYSSDSGNTWLKNRPDCIRNNKTSPDETELLRKARERLVEAMGKQNNNIRTPIDTNKKNIPQISYNELLRHPKWQRRRLEIMQRDEWKCRSCTETEKELHVHHLRYTSNKPWEEPDEHLITLCDSCHKAYHYLDSCPDFGFETFILICRLIDEIETYSMQEFIRKNKGNG